MRLDHLLSKDDYEKRRRLISPDRRWRAREEAVAAAARPKRPEGLGAEARQYEKRRRLPIDNDAKISYNDACRFV